MVCELLNKYLLSEIKHVSYTMLGIKNTQLDFRAWPDQDAVRGSIIRIRSSDHSNPRVAGYQGSTVNTSLLTHVQRHMFG